MNIKEQLTDHMKATMRSGDKERLGTIRLILAAIKQREIDERIELDDVQTLAVLEKMLKQRKDSIEQYEKANRQDLADVERAEVRIIENYLPAKLSDVEIETLIDAAMAETGANNPRDMGKVVAHVKNKAAGRADMGKVSALIKARLSG